MTRTAQPRNVVKVTVDLDRRLLERVKREAHDRCIPLRAVLEGALRERYDPEHAKTENLLILKELRALRNDVRRVDFGNRVLVETTTLTTKNLFACLPAPTPAGKAAGEGFYNALIAAVERVFSQNTPLLDKLSQTLLTEASSADFDALAEASESTSGKEPA